MLHGFAAVPAADADVHGFTQRDADSTDFHGSDPHYAADLKPRLARERSSRGYTGHAEWNTRGALLIVPSTWRVPV
jgi:hypothetical protein